MPPLPNTSSWHGAELNERFVFMVWCLVKHGDFTFFSCTFTLILFRKNLGFCGTWCGCEVPGMILLHDLKGDVRRYHSKDIPAPASACTSYDFMTLMTVV
jgi:hypothetical protein